MAIFGGQKASLAGEQGLLSEIGWYGFTYRADRIVVGVEGSVLRMLDADTAFDAPLESVEPCECERRTDVGDLLVSTAVRLTSGAGGWDGAVRFGARIPISDERVGLERDRTDVFASIGTRYRHGRAAVSAEAGISINGVVGRFDQTDPFIYAVSASLRSGRWTPAVTVVGQFDTREHGAPRGNEDLAEARISLRRSGRLWVQLDGLAGLARFSPDWGLRLRVGRAF